MYDYISSLPAYQNTAPETRELCRQNSEEYFLPIKGLEGVYEISNLGNVKRLAYNKRIGNGAFQPFEDKLLKPTDDSHGYLKVELYYNNKRYCLKIHRLIALHFIPNPNNYSTVNHIDGDSRNNSIDNLEWCTQKQNNQHKYKVLGWKRIIPKGKGHWNSKPVYSVDKFGNIERFDSLSTAEKITGAFNSNICKALSGKYKTVKGRKWFYDKPHEMREFIVTEYKS